MKHLICILDNYSAEGQPGSPNDEVPNKECALGFAGPLQRRVENNGERIVS